ncbi:MAG: protein-disulfide reductase DsbD family protein [Puniceicoccaceae bacterium]
MKSPARIFLTMFLLLGFAITGITQNSPFIRDKFVEAAVIGEDSHLVPGQPYRLGLLLRHDPHWHTYWKSSETGYATTIEWSLPEGFTIGELSWPTPKVYDFQGFTEYVYEGEVLLMATLLPPDDFGGESVEIGFSADWLMCEQTCVPGGIESKIVLPVSTSQPEPSAEWAGFFERTDGQLPSNANDYELAAWESGEAVVLQVKGKQLPDSVYFFDAQAAFKTTPENNVRKTDSESIEVVLDLPEGGMKPDSLIGVLKADQGWSGLDGTSGIEIDVPVMTGPPVVKETSWAGILVLAFVGGLILNLMPCVFPVLGIKIMGFVGQAGESRKKIVEHGLVFSLGVLLSFWILAAVLLLLRSGGNQLGWGFQLQSPTFVFILAMLLFAFALNMAGLFEVGQSAVGVGSNLTAKSGLSGSFFSGVLATVVATPCAAPFLAPALGAALTFPPLGSLAVFTFIAFGLAAPYLLLSIFPSLLKWLPKPGAWMETFKQFMSFLLFATVAYLVWVLAGQLTEEGGYTVFSLLKVLIGLVLLALGLWIYGRWSAFHRPKKVRLVGSIAALVIVLFSLSFGISGTRAPDPSATAIVWEKWSPGKAEALAAEGKTVYVDFTARWCVTCQTNKAAVFSSSRVQDAIEELDIVLLKADWTHQDPEISKALARFGRSAVPFNLVYGPAIETPIELPEVLVPGTVLDAIKTAKGS